MSNPTAHGALGRALIQVWGGGRRKSYKAKGWHAKLRELIDSPRGSAAADAVGWNPTRETIQTYLSDPEHRIRPDYESKIHQAYEVLAGAVWNPANERRIYAIEGEIDSGDRSEHRVLRIDGKRGQWDEIRRRYLEGDLTPEEAEVLFITEVIESDIGESTEPWNFPGSYYDITESGYVRRVRR